jgi:integrase/recombinase XerC
MTRLLEMPDTGEPLGRRDRAILELFYASGLRLSELVQLDLGDVNLSARIVRVMGKGKKQRLVPFNTNTKAAVSAWLKDRRRCAKPHWPATLESPERGPEQKSGASPCSSTSAARA